MPATLVIQRHSRQYGSLQNFNLATVLAGNRQKGVCQARAWFLYIRLVITEVVGDFYPGSVESANSLQGLGAERCSIDQSAVLCPDRNRPPMSRQQDGHALSLTVSPKPPRRHWQTYRRLEARGEELGNHWFSPTLTCEACRPAPFSPRIRPCCSATHSLLLLVEGSSLRHPFSHLRLSCMSPVRRLPNLTQRSPGIGL